MRPWLFFGGGGLRCLGNRAEDGLWRVSGGLLAYLLLKSTLMTSCLLNQQLSLVCSLSIQSDCC